MQPPLNFANAITQLKLMTNQMGLFTFTDDQITQAITQAWQDSYVVNIVWDSSLSYVIGTWQYPIPGVLNTVREIYLLKNSTSYPEKISPDLYEIVNGNIQFFPQVQNFLTDTYQLYLKGNYKLTISDSLLSDNMINYVLSNAAYILLGQLLFMKVFVFLRNDTTLADIINSRKEMQNQMLMYRQMLAREFESS